MGRIKLHITINIFYRTSKITPNIFFCKNITKIREEKKNEGRNIREENKMRGVLNRRPNDRDACALPIALHKTLQQTIRMLCYI